MKIVLYVRGSPRRAMRSRGIGVGRCRRGNVVVTADNLAVMLGALLFVI